MIQYQQTTNKDFSTQEPVEEPIIGYQPRFRPKEPEVEETTVTETTPEAKPVSQEQPQGEETTQKSISIKSKRYTDRNEFVKDLTEAYTKALKARGIDTAYAKMLVAQDALESGWGKHYAGNYNFGNIIIPAGSTESYTEGRDHDAQGNIITQKFRNYSSLDEWVNAKIDLLSKNRYQAFTGDSSPSAFYDRIKRGGYAVDKEYVDKMLRVYNSPILAKRGTKIPSKFDKLIDKIGFAKNGIKLPKFQQGKDFNISLNYKDYHKKPDNYKSVTVKTIGPYDWHPNEEKIDQSTLPQSLRIGSPYVLTEDSFNEDLSNRNDALTNTYFTDNRFGEKKIINNPKQAIIEGAKRYIDKKSSPFINYVINDAKSKGPVKLTAKNTDISKFLEGRTIDRAVLEKIKEVAENRNIDPYDILAHMLIEGERNIGVGSYYNTHDVITRQFGNKFSPIRKMDLNTFKTHIGLDPNKKYKQEVIQNQLDKFMDAFNKKAASVIVPKDYIDAVAVRIATAGRDFNPAQKGWTNPETRQTVKNSYVDMIDSAIDSLKSTYPTFDDIK